MRLLTRWWRWIVADLQESERMLAVLCAAVKRDVSLASCECGSSNVGAVVEPVHPHGDTVVYKCVDCGAAWMGTG